MNHRDEIFQGDGIRNLPVINLPDTTIKSVSSIILSNTCDIDQQNKRSYQNMVTYAPILSLKKFIDRVTINFGNTTANNLLKTIKEQKITSILYLPANGVIEDSIIFLDRINNCSIDVLKAEEVHSNKLFVLSDFGLYLLLLKLSIHFCRIKERVDRFQGQIL